MSGATADQIMNSVSSSFFFSLSANYPSMCSYTTWMILILPNFIDHDECASQEEEVCTKLAILYATNQWTEYLYMNCVQYNYGSATINFSFKSFRFNILTDFYTNFQPYITVRCVVAVYFLITSLKWFAPTSLQSKLQMYCTGHQFWRKKHNQLIGM